MDAKEGEAQIEPMDALRGNGFAKPVEVLCHCGRECDRKISKSRYVPENHMRVYYCCIVFGVGNCGYFVWEDKLDEVPRGDHDPRFCNCPPTNGRKILAKEHNDVTSIMVPDIAGAVYYTYQAYSCGNKHRNCGYAFIKEKGLHDDAIKCKCRCPALVKSVKSQGSTHGRLYASCDRPGIYDCKFFRWVN
jgi:hypothetical protein